MVTTILVALFLCSMALNVWLWAVCGWFWLLMREQASLNRDALAALREMEERWQATLAAHHETLEREGRLRTTIHGLRHTTTWGEA